MADKEPTQSPLENLRGKPQEQKHAIAQGAAVFVVIVLFIGWTMYFIHKIQKGSQQINLDAGAQNDFNFTNVKEAQDQLKTIYGDITGDLKELRDQAQQGSAAAKQEMVPQGMSGEETDAFTDSQQ